jgi:predicted TIM-barrel fold metal-dependent hydrolase
MAHPRYIDILAARRPNLTIIAGRPAWPWQDEMIAVMLHKPNVWNELHGWTPKYLTDSLKHDISAPAEEPRHVRRRLSAVHLRAADERLACAGLWRGRARKVMTGNAARLFGLAA